MLDILTSKMERYREFTNIGKGADEIGEVIARTSDDAAETLADAARRAEAEKLAKQASGGANPSVTNKVDNAATGTTPDVNAKTPEVTDTKNAAKVDETKVKAKNAEIEAKATATQKADADKLAKSDGMIDYCTKNPKTCIALGGTAALALYMIINKKTDPAKAAGEMLGEVGKGAFGGLLDGLGLGFIGDYLPYMSICCSGFMFLFMFLYMFKTFLH